MLPPRVPIPIHPLLAAVAVALVAVLAAQSLVTTAGAQEAPGGQPDHVQELLERSSRGERIRVLVELPNQRQQSVVAQQARASGATVVREFDRFPLLAMEVDANALRGLAQAPGLTITEDVPLPPTLGASIPVIGADRVHDVGLDGSGVAVAILDTGIDRDHPFFAGRVVAEACFSSDGSGEDSLCADGSTEQTGAGSASINVDACDDNGNNICDHGPHVAGIAAGDSGGAFGAPPAGVAPGADIIAIQVFTRFNNDSSCGGDPNDAPCVRTYGADQIAALEHVLDLSDDHEIAAANMSLGGGSHSSHCDGSSRKAPIDALRAANIATVISAGNDSLGEEVGAPGCISTAITVGSTTNTDAVAGHTNRGPLLDLFAPGSGIMSAVDNDGYGPKWGTSMAAPHVAGAWAVIRQAYPDLEVSEVLTLFQDTGAPITYLSGPGELGVDSDDWVNEVTTVRLDLLAALQPVVTVDNDTVTVDEGDEATNSGTFDHPVGESVTLSASVGDVTDDGGGAWSWSFETVDGPDESQTVTITATDDLGVEGEVTFDLVVENVAPTVTIDPAQVQEIDEGETLTVLATFTDPGILDEPFVADVVCYSDTEADPDTLAVTGDVTVTDPNVLAGTVQAECPYGDAGEFTVVVTVTDKDGDSGSDSFQVVVNNLDPTPEIDTTGASDVGGTPTFIGHIGEELDFGVRVTDPGSDDLILAWDWGDGSTAVTAEYLVNPPNPDPFPSPDMAPRDIFDEQSNTWVDGCLWTMTLTAEDDDGGSGADSAAVVIRGDEDRTWGSGYWLNQYRGQGPAHFDDATLACYVAIVEHMSDVFSDHVDADPADVLFPGGNQGDRVVMLDRELMTVWLNFANGAYEYDELVDTTGDGNGDTTFAEIMANAEEVRLDPDATRAEIQEQRQMLQRL